MASVRTRIFRAEHGSFESTVTLLEFSEAALDKATFDVPTGYRPALLHLDGRVDMTQADTFVNRIAAYWQDVGMVARGWFSF
jgi:hypothetical protein